MAKGLLFMAFDFSTAHEDEFHDWYDLEHVPERLRVPGFLNAERWIDEENPKSTSRPMTWSTPACWRARPTAPSAATTSRSGPSGSLACAGGSCGIEGEQLVPGDLTAATGRRRTAGRVDEHRSRR